MVYLPKSSECSLSAAVPQGKGWARVNQFLRQGDDRAMLRHCPKLPALPPSPTLEDAMNLSYSVAPSTLYWTQDLFTYIQAYKTETFPDLDAVYQQNGALIVPEITGHGAGGDLSIYFGAKFGNDASDITLDKPITGMSFWSVVDHVPAEIMIQTFQMHVFARQFLAVTSVEALERLLFRGNDSVLQITDAPDDVDDVVRTWDGNDSIVIYGSGGTDRYYGGAGNDSLRINDPITATTDPIHQVVYAYGGDGNDSLQSIYDGVGVMVDHLYGGSGNDGLNGFAGTDTLMGGAGADNMGGGAGRDVLDGGTGNDLLNGGTERDVFTGGIGVDRFNFTWGGRQPHYDSGLDLAARDVITDFKRGTDLLFFNESNLDDVTLKGHAAFDGINQVRWVDGVGKVTIFVNGDTDLAAEMAITVLGISHLSLADFQQL
jgi:Ca2+-binding RTX toxin-like protein